MRMTTRGWLTRYSQSGLAGPFPTAHDLNDVGLQLPSTSATSPNQDTHRPSARNKHLHSYLPNYILRSITTSTNPILDTCIHYSSGTSCPVRQFVKDIVPHCLTFSPVTRAMIPGSLLISVAAPVSVSFAMNSFGYTPSR
jgi:hypothetical protein